MNMVIKYDYPGHQWLAMQRVAALPLCSFLNVLMLLWPFFGIGNEMAGSGHTPACCLSKLRSSLEAGMKQLRVWLQYRWSMVEGLHYSDLCLFIKAQCIHSTYMEIIRRVLEWVRCWGMYVNSRMMIVSWLHRYSFAFRRDTSRKWP